MSPKRVLDGEGLWRSDKLARVQPPEWRAEFANLLPLAFSNGVFEVNARRIWATVYSYNREAITPEIVGAILAEFERVKMLFRWVEPDGKAWGFWVGINRPGRLPGESRRGINEAVGPEPPVEALRKFLDSNGIHAETIEQPTRTDSRLGSGSGIGSGSGSGSGKSITPSQLGGHMSPNIAAPPPASDLSRFMNVWNEQCGSLGTIRELTNERRTKLRGRLKSRPTFEQDFLAGVRKAAATLFLRGENSRGWKCSFDWLIEDDTNLSKVLEGAYDGSPKAPGNGLTANRDLDRFTKGMANAIVVEGEEKTQ